MNWTMPSNWTSIDQVALYMNTATGNVFWPVTLVVIFLISFITLSRFESTKAFLTSGFIITILGVLLYFGSLISETALYICFGILVLGIIGQLFMGE